MSVVKNRLPPSPDSSASNKVDECAFTVSPSRHPETAMHDDDRKLFGKDKIADAARMPQQMTTRGAR
jgi:hypothetical protein